MPENVPTAGQEVSPIHFSNPDIPQLEFAFVALLAHHILVDIWVVFVVIPKLTRQWLTAKPSTKKVHPHHPARWVVQPKCSENHHAIHLEYHSDGAVLKYIFGRC